MDGIKAEKRLLAPLRRAADEVIDTSAMSVHDLTRRIRDIVAGEKRPLQVTVESFGFKHGLPLDADHVVDVRFLKTPTGSTSCATSPEKTRPSPTTSSLSPAPAISLSAMPTC